MSKKTDTKWNSSMHSGIVPQFVEQDLEIVVHLLEKVE